jgi:hypothetical protein
MNNIELKRQIKNNKKSRIIKTEDPIGNQNVCIEILHENKMKYFEELQTVILKQKEQELQVLISNKMNYSDLENQIRNIKEKKEETDYYLRNMKLLEDYYIYLETDEAKQNNKIFGKKENTLSKQQEFLLLYNEINNITLRFKTDKKIDSRKKVKDNYNKHEVLTCNNCNNFDTIVKEKDYYVCSECSIVQDTIISNVVSYNERTFISNNNTVDYKRFNYFKEILLQIQGNELTDIPQEIIDKIINELAKENFTNLDDLTIEKVQKLLKKTGNSKWYEHTSRIISQINNKKVINIPSHIQQKLFYMFKKIDNVFDQYNFRANFFSFPYIIHKLFELLDLPEYYKYFPYLDNREKLHVQDKMWQKIVNSFIEANDDIDNRFNINWRYIKST